MFLIIVFSCVKLLLFIGFFSSVESQIYVQGSIPDLFVQRGTYHSHIVPVLTFRNNQSTSIGLTVNRTSMPDWIKYEQTPTFSSEVITATTKYPFSVKNGFFTYYIDSDSLFIFDTTSVVTTELVGFVGLKCREVANLFVKDDYVYVPCFKNGLRIVDVSNKNSPELVSVYVIEEPFSPLSFDCRDIYVVYKDGDEIAAVIDDFGDIGHLWMFNVTNKTNPHFISIYETPAKRGIYFDEEADLAYISSGFTDGFNIYNVSDIFNPFIIGNFEITFSSNFKVTKNNEFVFLAAKVGGLVSVDIRNKKNPVEAHRVFEFIPEMISVSCVVLSPGEKFAYVGTENKQLWIVNITDPFNMTILGKHTVLGDDFIFNTIDLYFVPVPMVITAGTSDEGSMGGIQAYVVLDPSNPFYFNAISLEGDTTDLVINGDYAYVISFSMVRVIDISGAHPYYVGVLLDPHFSYPCYRQLEYLDGYLYISDCDKGLKIVDVTEPTSPILVSSLIIESNRYVLDVKVVRDIAYLAVLNQEGLCTVNVSNKSAPFVQYQVNTGVGSISFSLLVGEDDGIIRILGNNGLQLWDTMGLDQEREPVFLFSLNLGESDNAIHRNGNITYFCSGDWLRVVDTSNPSQPELVGSYFIMGRCLGIFAEGNRNVFVGREDYLNSIYSILILDVSNPKEISILEYIASETETKVSAVRDNTIFTVSRDIGVSLLRYGDIRLFGTPNVGDCKTSEFEIIASDISLPPEERVNVSTSLLIKVQYVGFLDEFCEVYFCHGKLGNDTACGKNKEKGSCYNQTDPTNPYGECFCNPGYFGEECGEITTCDEIMSNDTSNVCSGGEGECSGFDDCKCYHPDQYTGSFCQIPICYGWESVQEDFVCSGHGECLAFDFCGCHDNYYGIDCQENIENAYFVDSRKLQIDMVYILLVETFNSADMNVMLEDTFNCSYIVENWDEFLVYETSYCKFHIRTLMAGVSFTERLLINIIDEDEYEDVFGDDENIYDERVPSLDMALNMIVVSETLNGSEIVEIPVILIVEYDDEDDDVESLQTDDFVEEFLWALVSVPVVFVGLILCSFGIVCCILLTCVCCVILFCLCLFLVGGLSSSVVASQKMKLSKFEELDNIELLLTEQKLAKDVSRPKISINKHLFEVDPKKIKLLQQIGQGGSDAVVYKADWNGKIVAFKCFKTRTICGSQHLFEEFEKEASLLSSVAHPNIIAYFGSVIKEPRVGYLMEYCENGDLSYHINQLKKNEEVFLLREKIRMLHEIASAMSYLHQRKVIHRDLKLENVLLDDAFTCKVMDFGISRLIEETQQRKTTGIGTSVYMAPEIVNTDKYNEKCDVFSYSIMMYIIYYENQKPYGPNSQFIEARVAANPYLRPKVDASCPLFLKNLMITGWDDNVSKRPSFDEIVSYLIKAQEELNMTEKTPKGVELGENLEAAGLDNSTMDHNGMFVFVKRKMEWKSESERFFLMYRTFDCLISLIEKKYPGEKVKGVFINREERTGGDLFEIKTDEDLEKQLKPNELIDVDFYDPRDDEIVSLRKGMRELEEEKDELRKEISILKKKIDGGD